MNENTKIYGVVVMGPACFHCPTLLSVAKVTEKGFNVRNYAIISDMKGTLLLKPKRQMAYIMFSLNTVQQINPSFAQMTK
jgi:hypothetical protein